jgi:ATP-dependent exoDNAse (exonuclease V) beta subunit
LLQSFDWFRHDFDAKPFLEKADKAYCATDQTASITLMTIHKSKGLEFDHVILPGLEKTPRPDDAPLITWQNMAPEPMTRQLCIAPMRSPDAQEERIYAFCRYIESQKLAQERRRLLYVATTRAKRSLTFFARLKTSSRKDQHFTIPKKSFAEALWPWLESHARIIETTEDTPEHTTDEQRTLTQPTDIFVAHLAKRTQPTLPTINPDNAGLDQVDLDGLLTRHHASHLGEIVHTICDQLSLGESAKSLLAPSRLNHLMQRYPLTATQLAETRARLQTMIPQLIADPTAQWLLNPQHKDAHSEWTILERTNHGHRMHIIDRTFIDEQTRWIIDYKTAQPHPGENMDDFLATQQSAHKTQLTRYAQCLIAMGEQRPVQCGLYFPMVQRWVSWAHVCGSPQECDILG